jgi:hypothetical protein
MGLAMADERFPLRIQQKRKTTAEWAALNPVLLVGEPGIEVLLDGSTRTKFGDGTKTWSQLPYLEAAAELPQPLGTSDTPTFAGLNVPGLVVDGGTFN